MPTVTTSKSELRAKLRHRRDGHVAALAEWEHDIAFARAPSPLVDCLAGAQVVGIYAAHRNEPDIMRIGRALAAAGHRLALPRLLPDRGAMEFAAYDPGDALCIDRLGIASPGRDAMAVAPDAILCPLLGFDRAMRRIGQGGGYYDRVFAALPAALRIGIAWSVQEIDAIPIEAHDVTLHAVLTEREWIAAP